MNGIKDSGARRKFESGAVRDIAENKGRMDLMPLEIIGDLYSYIEKQTSNGTQPLKFSPKMMTYLMDEFIQNGSEYNIYYLMWSFICDYYNKDVETAILDVSIHYEQGAQKYEERNWEKGIPFHCYVDSALRHGFKYIRRDSDEHHERAFLWNLLGLLWSIKNKPDMNDLPYLKKSNSDSSKEFTHLSITNERIVNPI